MKVPVFKKGDRVYRIYKYDNGEIADCGWCTVGDLGEYWDDDGWWYYIENADNPKNTSAWEDQLIPEHVYSSPLYKLMSETQEDE